MSGKRFKLQIAVLAGLALTAAIFIVAIPALVQAQGVTPGPVNRVDRPAGTAGAIAAAVPAVDFQKTPNSQLISSGGTAVFTFTLDNTGDEDLLVLDGSDPLCDDPDSIENFDGDTNSNFILDTNEVWTATCTVTGQTIDFTNVATITFAPVATPSNQEQRSDSASVTVINPSIQITKSPDTQTINSGSTANFNIRVENTGDATLTNINITDAQAPDCDNSFGQINPGNSQNYNCSVNNVQESFVNSATATGEPPVGPDVSHSDAAQVLVQEVVDLCTASDRPDMIAYWKLDETGPGAPINYDDFYGGHDGIACPGGNCPISTQGRLNNAQLFDDSSTGIDASTPGDDAFNWDKDASFSFETWIKGISGATCAATNQVIIGRDDADPNSDLHWWLGCDGPTGQARFRLEDVSDITADLQNGPPINDGQWHHLVAVRDGVNDVNRLYVDAVEVDAVSIDYSVGSGFGADQAAVNIGYLDLSSGFHFEGTIDQVAIYNGVLGAGVITDHYNGRLGNFSPDYCTGLYPPTILSTPSTTAVIDNLYNYDVNANGELPPTYVVTGPVGMTISSTTGLISWTPVLAQQGNHSVTVQASNSEGTDSQQFAISVTDAYRTYLPLMTKGAKD